MPENASYVWMVAVFGELKVSVFENIRLPVDGVLI